MIIKPLLRTTSLLRRIPSYYTELSRELVGTLFGNIISLDSKPISNSI